MFPETATKPPIQPDERPTLTDWATMFGVSTQYKEKSRVESHVFDMKIFKQNLNKSDSSLFRYFKRFCYAFQSFLNQID